MSKPILQQDKDVLYVLNDVYLGVLSKGPTKYLQVLVDRNKGGPLHPYPMVSQSDNLRKATADDFNKFPLSGTQHYQFIG